MNRWIALGIVAALGCGGGGGREVAASEASGGGEAAAPVDHSPEALLAAYARNGQSFTRNNWFPGGPLASLASDAMDALRAYGASRSHTEEYLTLEVVSDWYIGRDPRSGIVVNRQLNAAVITRFPDGRCMQYVGTFFQEAVGDDFSSRMTTQGLGGGLGVPCEMAEVVSERPHVAR